MKKLRVFFICRKLDHYGGAERQLVALALGLHARGHKVAVAVFYQGGKLERQLADAGIRLIHLGKTGRWSFIRFWRELLRQSRAFRPDIVHGYLAVANILALCLRVPLRGALAVAGVRASELQLSNYDRAQRVVLAIERRAIRYHDLVISNSQAGRSYIKRYSPNAHLVCIPNGIDTQRFQYNEKAREELRRQWGVETHSVIGVVARLDPMKGYESLIEAVARLGPLLEQVRVVCYGAGSSVYAQRLHGMVESQGLAPNFIWQEPRDDMENVYSGFDILCLSSIYGEGFPNVVGEAMSCGISCVVSKTGDAAEVVGATGQVVPPGAAAALADALRRAVIKKKDSAEACRYRIVSKFSIDAMVNRTEEALTRLQN